MLAALCCFVYSAKLIHANVGCKRWACFTGQAEETFSDPGPKSGRATARTPTFKMLYFPTSRDAIQQAQGVCSWIPSFSFPPHLVLWFIPLVTFRFILVGTLAHKVFIIHHGFAWDLAQGFVIIVVIVFRTRWYRLPRIKIRNFITEWSIILKRKTEVCLPCFCHFLSRILQIKIYDIVQAGLKLKTLLKAGATDKGPCAHLWLYSLQVHFMTAVHYLKPCTSMEEFQRRAESKDVLLLSVSVWWRDWWGGIRSIEDNLSYNELHGRWETRRVIHLHVKDYGTLNAGDKMIQDPWLRLQGNRGSWSYGSGIFDTTW